MISILGFGLAAMSIVMIVRTWLQYRRDRTAEPDA